MGIKRHTLAAGKKYFFEYTYSSGFRRVFVLFLFFIFNFFFPLVPSMNPPRPLPIAGTLAIKTGPGAWLRVYAWIRSPDQRVDTIIILFTRVEHVTAEHRVQRAGTWLLRAGNNDRMLARPSLPLVLVSPLMDRPATLFTATRPGLDFESRTRSFVPSSLDFLSSPSSPIFQSQTTFQFQTTT